MKRVPYAEGLLPPRQELKDDRESLLRRFSRNQLAVLGLSILIVFVIIAIFADRIAPYPYEEQNLQLKLSGPSFEHLFGTDNFGRDVFSRVIYGARISIVIGLISVGIGCSIGSLAGILSAWCGGIVDHAIMCVIDIMQSIPSLLLAIALSATLGAGIGNAMIAVGISSVPTYARIARGSVMDVKGLDFIDAAIVGGAGSLRIIFRHIIPNILAPTIVQASAGMAGAILTSASLSFIGLGVQPPAAEWGSMISAGRAYMRNAWWIVTFPGIAIMAAVSSLNLMGDGLRDALDTKER